MLLRICLIIALVAGLAGLALSFKVSDRIKEITAQRDQFEDQKKKADDAAAKSKKEADAAKKAEKEARAQLGIVTNSLATVTAKAVEQEKLAKELSGKLDKTTKDLTEANQNLAQWVALGYNPDQIKNIKNDFKKLTEERDAFAEEKLILSRRIVQLDNELSIFKGSKKEVQLPAGIKGAVAAVDPKYGFVVLNIGSDQQLLEGGKLVVTRQGKLVGKVRISRMEPNSAIANIMPGWAQADIMEGDQVITSYEALAQP